MKKRCVIVAGGECSDVSLISENDFVIAADSGLNVLLKWDFVPDLIVGDFDSYTADFPQGVETIVLPTRKDDTDLLFAARKGVELGFSDFVVLGGYGSRPDQNYAMYETLLWIKNNCNNSNVKAVCNGFIVTLIINESLNFKVESDEYLSVFAYGNRALGVSIIGSEYEIIDSILTPGLPIGVSNESKNDGFVTVSVKEGSLLVFVVNKNI